MFCFSNAPYRVCFSFCLDAKRNKRSRPCLTGETCLSASAPVHQWCSRWLTSEAGVKLNVPKGNKFSLACKLKSDRRATQHKAFLIPFAALGKRNTSNL